MDANIKKVIEKIRGLRALSQSSNAHEAAAAAAAADRLAQQYRIEEALLELADGTTDEMPEAPTVFHRWNRRPGWERMLLNAVCQHYDVAYCYVRGKNHRFVATVFGREGDVALAREMYAYIHAEIDHLARPVRGRSSKLSFRTGAVAGVLRAMKEAKEQAFRRHATAAIVVADRGRQAENAMLRRFPQLRPDHSPLKLGGDEAAFARGFHAGQNISLQPGKRIDGKDPT